MKKLLCCLLALLLAGCPTACDAPAESQTVEDGLSWYDELEADAAAHCTDNLELLNAVAQAFADAECAYFEGYFHLPADETSVARDLEWVEWGLPPKAARAALVSYFTEGTGLEPCAKELYEGYDSLRVSVDFYGLKTWREHPEWFEDVMEPPQVPWDEHWRCEEYASDWMLTLTVTHDNGADDLVWDYTWFSDETDVTSQENVVDGIGRHYGDAFFMSGL